MDFDDRELQLIEPLRSLRMIHHSAWLARRWDDPAFKAGFPWFEQSELLGAADDRIARTGRADDPPPSG